MIATIFRQPSLRLRDTVDFSRIVGRTIMLCYFEPFGLYKKNSTQMIARHLMEMNFFPDIHYVQLPVVFGRAGKKAMKHIKNKSPDIVLGLGQSGHARRLYIERVALNVNHTVFVDNAGNRPFIELINSQGPVAYWTTMPYKKIMEVCSKSSISIKLSHFAGTYVCNNVLYMLLDAVRREKMDTKVGFIHVPSIKTKKKGKCSLEYLAWAIQKILTVLKYEAEL